MSEVFEKQYKEHGLKSQRLYPNEELLRFIGSNFLNKIPYSERKKIKILEVGCGSGANLWMLAKEGFDIYGIDSSKTAIGLCKKHLGEKWDVSANLKIQDFRELGFNNETFDVVIDVVSLQHISFREHYNAIKEIYRVLKKNGFFFSYHLGEDSYSYKNNDGNEIDRYTIDNVNNPKAPLNNNGITCFINDEEYKGILKEIGFNKINIEHTIKTYNNREIKIQYLTVTAIK